jgi:hypothetical protein
MNDTPEELEQKLQNTLDILAAKVRLNYVAWEHNQQDGRFGEEKEAELISKAIDDLLTLIRTHDNTRKAALLAAIQVEPPIVGVTEDDIPKHKRRAVANHVRADLRAAIERAYGANAPNATEPG